MTDEEILRQNGWIIECESPYEIRHSDGSFAAGNAIKIIINSLRDDSHPNKTIQFRYKNWKGVESIRKVVPVEILFESTDYHKEDQWFLHALDVEKAEYRDFAILDILEFIKK